MVGDFVQGFGFGLCVNHNENRFAQAKNKIKQKIFHLAIFSITFLAPDKQTTKIIGFFELQGQVSYGVDFTEIDCTVAI